MMVNIPSSVSKVTLFVPKSNPVGSVAHLSNITIDGLQFRYTENDTTQLANFVICSTPVASLNRIQYQLKNIALIPSTARMSRQARRNL